VEPVLCDVRRRNSTQNGRVYIRHRRVYVTSAVQSEDVRHSQSLSTVAGRSLVSGLTSNHVDYCVPAHGRGSITGCDLSVRLSVCLSVPCSQLNNGAYQNTNRKPWNLLRGHRGCTSSGMAETAIKPPVPFEKHSPGGCTARRQLQHLHGIYSLLENCRRRGHIVSPPSGRYLVIERRLNISMTVKCADFGSETQQGRI